MKRVVGKINLAKDDRYPKGVIESIIEMEQLR